MANKYQDKLNELQEQDFAYITKLSLLYEINCQLDATCDDDLLNQIYQAYIDNRNFVCPCAFVDAICNWCEAYETSFNLIADYKQMLNELY